MGARRVIALSAAAASMALAGCALLSGASDLTVGEPPPGGEEGTRDAASGDVAQTDAVSPVDASVDAASDAPAEDAADGGRIKDITFENNSLTHPTTGADGITGTPKIVGAADSLAGTYSMEAANDPSFVTENFPAVPELFVSFLVSIDPVSSSGTVSILRIASAPVDTSIDISVGNGASRNVIVTQGTGSVVFGGSLPNDDAVYRVGLHFGAGGGADKGVIEAFIAKDGDPLVRVANSTTATNGSMSRLQIGVISGAGSKMIFDNIRLDSRSF